MIDIQVQGLFGLILLGLVIWAIVSIVRAGRPPAARCCGSSWF